MEIIEIGEVKFLRLLLQLIHSFIYHSILYDGANGVGAKKVKYLKEGLAGSLMVDMYNDEIIGSGKLNYLVSF